MTDELVSQVARLARLALTTEERVEMKAHLEKILSFVESLQELDTTSIDPTHFSVATRNVWREDVVDPSLARELGLRNAPAARDGSFVVPRIIDSGADEVGGA